MENNLNASRRLASWLWLLTGLFALRVVAQPLARLGGFEWLPPFQAWHSATLPYGLLLTAQAVILFGMVHTTLRFARGDVRANRRLGIMLMAFGSLYFVSMLGRLILGLTVFAHNHWFASWLPALFHLVLAAYVLAIARYHLDLGREQAA
jgi:hypothetical protein